MFLGEIIRLQTRNEYIKAVIATEIGYETKYFVTRTPNKSLFTDFNEGDQVLLTGYNIEKDGKFFFKLESIVKRAFESCPECDLPKVAEQCILKHEKEAQRLTGTWKVVHKIDKDNLIKVFFDKSNFVFAAVARPTDWFYDIFQELKDENIVEVKGWKYKSRTTLRYLKIVE